MQSLQDVRLCCVSNTVRQRWMSEATQTQTFVDCGWMATLIPETQAGIAGIEIVVLSVEDNEDDFFLLQRAFQQAGIKARLLRAKDGIEAREYLDRATASGALPACVVVDLRLPRMDGFELLAYIKTTAALNHVPVTVLSTSSNPMDMARAYRLGAKTFLVKPSALDALVQMSLAMQTQWTNSRLPPQKQ